MKGNTMKAKQTKTADDILAGNPAPKGKPESKPASLKPLSAKLLEAAQTAAKNYAASEELAALTDKGMAALFGAPDANGCPKMSFLEFEQRRVAFEAAYREETGANVEAANKAFGRAYKRAGYDAKPKSESKAAGDKAAQRSELQDKAKVIASGAASTDMLEAQALAALDRKQEAEKLAKLAKGKEAEAARKAKAEAAKQERELLAALKIRKAAEHAASAERIKAIREEAKEWTPEQWMVAAEAVHGMAE